MGQTKSKNILESISEIGVDISNDVYVTKNTISNINTTFNLRDCFISGSVNFNNVADIIGFNRQLTKSIQNTETQNNIAEKINQKAISIAKSYKLGYKETSNFISNFSSKSTDIINALKDISNNASYLDSTFNCDRQFIIGNVNVGYNSREEFWNGQVNSYNQAQNISQDISKNIDQEIGDNKNVYITILTVVMVVALVSFILAYPLGGLISENRGYTLALIGIFMLFLPIILYYSKIYPFYYTHLTCSRTSNFSYSDCQDCIDISTQKFITPLPPLRYMNNIFYNPEDNMPFGLLDMVISKLCQGDSCLYNMGYNAQTWYTSGYENDRTKWKEGVDNPLNLPPLPNPLLLPKLCTGNNYCKIPDEYIKNSNVIDSSTPSVYSPSIKEYNQNNVQKNINLVNNDQESITNRLYTMATSNKDEWKRYINTYGKKGALHARFVLCDYLGYDTTIYIEKDEETRLKNGDVVLAGSVNNLYNFTDFTPPKSWDKRIDSKGVIHGPLGVCKDRKYKVSKTFRVVKWVFFGLGILCIIVLILYITKAKNE